MSWATAGNCIHLGDKGIGFDRCKAGVTMRDVRTVLDDAIYDAEAAKGRRGFRAAWPCFVGDRHLCPACPSVRPRTAEEAKEAETLAERMSSAAERGVCMDCDAPLVRRGHLRVCPNGHDFSTTACDHG